MYVLHNVSWAYQHVQSHTKILQPPPNTRHGEHFPAVSVPPGVYHRWHQTAGWLEPSVASCQTPWAVSGWPPNVECFENWMWSHYAWIFWRFRHINHSFTDSLYKQSVELGSGKLSCIWVKLHIVEVIWIRVLPPN